MSRERPLLMRGPLVVASLEGRKTQTRRLVTPATSDACDDAGKASREDWARMDWTRALTDGPALIVPGVDAVGDPAVWRVTPRIRPGDHLYVRETWQTGAALDDEAPAMLAAWAKAAGREPCGPVRYVADGATRDEHLLAPGSHYGEHWGRGRPGIHMPRWASRLVPAVTEIRVQRVQDITEEDAQAEGVVRGAEDLRPLAWHFANLWDSINGERPGCSWAANPWTWAISYHRET